MPSRKISLQALLACGWTLFTATGSQVEFDQLIAKMELDVLELKRQVERVYGTRCDSTTLERCAYNVYDNCISSHPDQECPGGAELTIPICGDGITCGARYTYNSSNVILPTALANGEDGNPTDPQVIESICFSQALDEYFVAKYDQDKDFWASFGLQPAWMQFGSQ
jgi:hypothetical protein